LGLSGGADDASVGAPLPLDSVPDLELETEDVDSERLVVVFVGDAGNAGDIGEDAAAATLLPILATEFVPLP
jgi:hypothetical protein